jgi:demethylmenaquinone methyltransferase/2-methoxy-6-polyprenyl-1,4-benzoquinol methylase
VRATCDLDSVRRPLTNPPDRQDTMKKTTEEQTTDFGFEKVPIEEKARLVGAIFDSLADRYDLTNDVMSFGMHRLWRRFAVKLADIRPGQTVLDLAGGTGDLTSRLAQAVGSKGLVVLAEINDSMMSRAQVRFANGRSPGNVECVLADAEQSPFADNQFDVVTIAFGMRNITRKQAALRSMFRVLRPGGRAVVLEFSHPVVPGFGPLYDFYSFHVMPAIGRLIAGKGGGFQYLAESIRVHPDQDTFMGMMEEAGFERCEYHNLSGGIVAVHKGFKPE